MRLVLSILVYSFGIGLLAAGQPFVLTESQLAKNLGLSKETLEQQTTSLSRYISGQSKILRDCRNDRQGKHTLCSFIEALETTKEGNFKKVSEDARYFTNAPTVISPRTFQQAQSAKPGDALDRLKNYNVNEVLGWLPKLILWQSCPQSLLVASLRMYEVALPSARAQASLEVGYKRAMRCLKSHDSYYEITHLRQALLRYGWGDRLGAERSLKLALQADEPKAKEVTLFWLGNLESSPKVKQVYWEQLIEEFPLSFHAISASKLMGKDMYDRFLDKSMLTPQRRASDRIAQMGILWLESLYMYGEQKNALALSYKLFKKFKDRYSAANFAYIAALADKYSLPGEAMELSSLFVRRVPNLINNQTLRYLYPRPFEKTFGRVNQNIDPLLTLSVAKQESGFNPYARSPANAMGLMQIMPATAVAYSPHSSRHLYDVDTSIELGGKILADLVNRLGRMEYALAAYNAGFNRVESWKKRYATDDPLLFIDLIPYSETRGYVANVLRNHYWYTNLYEANKSSL